MTEKTKSEPEPAPKETAAPPKKKKEERGKEKKEETKEVKPRVTREHKPDFKYIVRLAETDLNGERPIQLALADIRGIGVRTAILIADKVGIPRRTPIGDLSDEQLEMVEDALNSLHEFAPPWMLNRQNDLDTGADVQVIGPELQVSVMEDIGLMKKIRCYKGIRHETGQKVRGQRTKSNGRTGLTIGVMRKAAMAAAAAAKADESKKKEEKQKK
ncbi:MAG: 30S ribosomal protein S13 [Thermoplasmata archaeon]